MSQKYWDYIKERNLESVVETPYGFAVYKKISIDTVYLTEIWVEKAHRRSNKATELMELVILEAHKLGASKLVGSCCPSAVGGTESLKSMLARNFKLLSCENDIIYLVKEI